MKTNWVMWLNLPHWGKIIVTKCCYTFKTTKFLIVYYNDIFSRYSIIGN